MFSKVFNIDYVHIFNPIATLQWKVHVHTIRNKVLFKWFSIRLLRSQHIVYNYDHNNVF